MKSYKYKLRPSARVVAIFEAWLAICCELYNAALKERHDAYRMAGKSVGYCDQSAQLPEVKVEREDIARVHSQVLQNVLKRVAFAFDNFFRRVKHGQKPVTRVFALISVITPSHSHRQEAHSGLKAVGSICRR